MSQTAARALSARAVEVAPQLHYIDGAFRPGQTGTTFETLSPVTNLSIAKVAEGLVADVDDAVGSARRAFDDGPWPRLSAKERAAVLRRIAGAIRDDATVLVGLECLDIGMPIAQMRGLAARAAENFDFFAAAIEELSGQAYRVGGDFLNYTIHKPVGVAALIMPWNAPLMLSTWRIAPCLAAGNTIVLKPAEWSPLTATRLAVLLDEVGLPPGVFNVVHGFGETAGAPLAAHPGVDLVSFTGESATGSAIMAVGAPTLKRYSFELGGKSPVVVFADADFERAVDAVVAQIFTLNGQRCTAGSRLLAEAPVYEDLVQAVAERARNIRVGDPFDEATELGPLIRPEHHERVLGYLESAVEEGARCLAGGRRPVDLPEGNFLEATVFADVTPEMRVFREEIFGPVLVATPFESEADAIRLANATDYGLAAYVWTNELTRAHRVAQAIDAGLVWINSQNVRDLRTPFGGMKQSGIGREGGHYSFEFYCELETIHVALGEHPIPRLGPSVNTDWVTPPFDIVRFAHVELVVTDLAASREFYVDTLGLVPTVEASDAIYLRGYEERLHHSLVLRVGPQPLVDHIALRVRGPSDLDGIAEAYTALGCEPVWVEGVELGQGPAVRVCDPLGFPLEFFHEMEQAECLLQRYDLYRGARVTRADHVNFYVPDAEEGFELYRQLGFRCSEYIASDHGERLVAVWLYRKQTVHDIALTTGYGPRVHHFAYTTAETAAIPNFCDMLAGNHREGVIERGPGRHGVSNAFFVYLRDPDGHRIELYTGDYYTGDPDHRPIRWSASDARRRTFWGHHIPDSWFDEGSHVRAPGGGPAELKAPILDERLVAAE